MRGFMSYDGAMGLLALGRWMRDALAAAFRDEYGASGSDPRADPLLAIEFAINYAGPGASNADAALFLECWQEGDWKTIHTNWPNWAPFMASKGIDVFLEPPR